MVKNNPTRAGVLRHLLQIQQNWNGQLPVDCDIVRRMGEFVGNSIVGHQVLERAMDKAREHIVSQDKLGVSVDSGLIILADSMTASKGRFARAWHAPEGGVWGCLLHANTLMPRSRQFLPLAVGVACCETMRSYDVTSASLRWVNDVLVEGRKIAGFLIESYTSKQTGEEYNLVGFGVNVNNCNFPDELDSIATSLSKCIGQEIDVVAFSERFFAHLAWNIGLIYLEEEKFLQDECYSGVGGKHLVLQRFMQLTDTVNRRVVYGFDVMTAPQYEATVVGVDEHGGLMMQFADGAKKTEYSGEVRYL